jgi:Zn-dependent protease
MASVRQNSIRLFRLAGVEVSLHWSWFLVAVYEIQGGRGTYSSIIWSVLEYLALFAIVLTHEFGHAMACRQVGGTADHILLWPFGGVAYVNPPQRPGATLWSIAAGPLVNVALAPLFLGAYWLARTSGWADTNPDAFQLLWRFVEIDIGLLIFNILPIYPLDGGQILRSLLWFMLGKAHSLMVATVLGIIGIVGFIGLAIFWRNYWLGFISVYLLLSCWGGLQQARKLLQQARLPRRLGYTCPSCKTAPPIGAYWGCSACKQPFDTFETQGVCPHCSTRFATTTCLDCRVQSPLSEWIAGAYPGVGTVNGGYTTR